MNTHDAPDEMALNRDALRRFCFLIGCASTMLTYKNREYARALMAIIRHVELNAHRIEAALVDTLVHVEVPNEEPIDLEALDVNSHREGSRLQPGQKVYGLVDVEPGENGTDDC